MGPPEAACGQQSVLGEHRPDPRGEGRWHLMLATAKILGLGGNAALAPAA